MKNLNQNNLYKPSSYFRFGKYRGKTLEEVFRISPSYIDWCLRNISNFEITQSTFEYLILTNPVSEYKFSDGAHSSIINETFETHSMDAFDNFEGTEDQFERWLEENGFG